MTEVDTPPEMLPPVPHRPVSWWPDRCSRWFKRQFGLRFSRRFILGVGVGAALGLVAIAPAQWLGRIIPGHAIVDGSAVALKPGSAQPTDDRVFVADLETFPPVGEILFTTVTIDSSLTVLDWIKAELDDNIDLRSREQLFGTRTSGEQRSRDLQKMQVSKDTAVIAALEYLGVAAVVESGVGFNGVVEDGPVDGLVKVAEVIVAINDLPVTGVDSLVDFLATVQPGEDGTLTLEHVDTGVVRHQEFTFGVHPEGRDGGFIGIADLVVRAVDVPLPFDIQIDTGSIGGPSAGLAFTLTLIDLLTEGELTGGNRVAVTGTISAGGVVGNVGSVAQKAVAANEAGASIFIVPIDSVAAAEGTAGSMPIVGVSTLEEAIAALVALDGDVTDLALDLAASPAS